jgi:hypothetical protein
METSKIIIKSLLRKKCWRREKILAHLPSRNSHHAAQSSILNKR